MTAAVGPDQAAIKDQSYQYSKSPANPPGNCGRAAAGQGSKVGWARHLEVNLGELSEESTPRGFRMVMQQVTPSRHFFDPGCIDYKCDHLMHFVLEHLFVRLILFARMISRMAAPLLILLDGCHAESLSNEQGQELHKNLITCYNDMAQ